MMSNPKRMRYVSSENELSDSESDSTEEYRQKKTSNINGRKTGGSLKWMSKNAILARENRLKKKLYVSNLEDENRKLKKQNEKITAVVESQSHALANLKNEIKYLKSVIINSRDIGRLMRNINHTTGMSVTTSMDENNSLSKTCISKHEPPFITDALDLWEEQKYNQSPINTDTFLCPSAELNDLFDDHFDGLLSMQTSDEYSENAIEVEDFKPHLNEHNYTFNETTIDAADGNDDVGVCLHVSKHRVSLEFCSSCSSNASQSWKD